MAIDQTHPRRAQQHYHITDFIRMSNPALSSHVPVPGWTFKDINAFPTGHGFSELGLKEAGRDCIDADVVLAGLESALRWGEFMSVEHTPGNLQPW